METEEQDRILGHLSYLHAELQLGPWQIILSNEHTPEGEDDPRALASIDIADGRWVALVRVSRHWAQFNDRERGDSLLHEVLHLLTHDMYATARQWAVHYNGMDTDPTRMALVQLSTEEEMLVDRLTPLLGAGLGPYPAPLSALSPNVRLQDGWC